MQGSGYGLLAERKPAAPSLSVVVTGSRQSLWRFLLMVEKVQTSRGMQHVRAGKENWAERIACATCIGMCFVTS